jgi:putative membrane protein
VLIRWLFAALHLMGLGIALGSVWARARALGGPLDRAGLQRVLYADNWWGVSAVILVATGLVRVLAGLEKGMDYYLQNHVFWGKMALLLGIFALEMAPMTSLIRWRNQLSRGETPDTVRAGRFARISYIQALLLLLMILAATAMARGLGVVPRG